MMSFNFQTENLTLRAFEPDDSPDLAAYLNAPGLIGRRYLPWGFSGDLPLSAERVDALIKKWNEKKKGFHLAVILSVENQLIGHLNASWDWDPHCPGFSLAIADSHQRGGFGRETARWMLRHFFENTQAHCVEIGLADWNHAANQLALHLGFSSCGKLRRAGYRHGAYFDWLGFDILRPEWIAQKGE